MISLLKKAMAIPQVWPKDVWASINYHGKKHMTLMGEYGDTIEGDLKKLPPASLIQRSLDSDRALGKAATVSMATENNPFLAASSTCGMLGCTLQAADLGFVSDVNPILRRSLILLRDKLLPPSSDNTEALQVRVDRLLEVASERRNDIPRGALGFCTSEDIMLLVVGFQRVVHHPSFANYELAGPLPKRRSLKIDALSLICFLITSVLFPTYIGRSYSVLKGVGACLAGMSLGAIPLRLWQGNQARQIPRQDTAQPSRSFLEPPCHAEETTEVLTSL